MSFDYIRRYYRVPAKRLGRVRVGGQLGTITRATHYVWIRLDGMKFSRPYHPTDGIEYLAGPPKEAVS